MIKIVLLGGGNVAHHLATKFISTEGIELVQIYNRTLSNILKFSDNVAITNNLKELKEADLYIISISDNEISTLSSKLNIPNKLIVHTSGSMNLSELNSISRKGVFYPLQSFSKDTKIDFSEVPFCLETENDEDFKLLQKITNKMGSSSYKIDSEQREKLHVAAVFVNNFVNHLYTLGNEICDENNIPFDILKPLINETSNKLADLHPCKAQTGPAKRGDTKTIENHLKILSKNKQEIYTLLTKSIANSYGKKL